MQIMNFEFGPLQVFGLLGNVAFTSRFFVQWIASERAKKVVVPEAFWWLSIAGTSILLVYFLARRDIVGTLGYIVNIVPYARNLRLFYKEKRLLRESGGGQ